MAALITGWSTARFGLIIAEQHVQDQVCFYVSMEFSKKDLWQWMNVSGVCLCVLALTVYVFVDSDATAGSGAGNDEQKQKNDPSDLAVDLSRPLVGPKVLDQVDGQGQPQSAQEHVVSCSNHPHELSEFSERPQSQSMQVCRIISAWLEF